jgi:hypothetical protein
VSRRSCGGTIWTGVNGQTTGAAGHRRRCRPWRSLHAQAKGAEGSTSAASDAVGSLTDTPTRCPVGSRRRAAGAQCKSVDEIVAEVKGFAVEHPDDEWIVGASYESSMASGGLFDARWLDAAVADRPVVLRAWDYHTVWCNSVALERAGITADTPDPVLGEIPRREDGSPLGTLREWGAVDLLYKVVPERDPKVRVGALRTAAEYYLASGVTWVQDAWVEPADVDTPSTPPAKTRSTSGSTSASTPTPVTSTPNSSTSSTRVAASTR